MEWIGVKDRLPEADIEDLYGKISKDILLYSEDDAVTEASIFIGFMQEDGEFYDGNGKIYDVTHWAPLPKPTKNN